MGPTSGVGSGSATRGEPHRQQLPNQSRASTIVTAPPVIPAPSSTAFLGGNMNKLYYPTVTHLVHDRDRRPTYFGESRTGISDRLDQSSHHLPTSASTRPSLDESTRGRKKVESTAGVIITCFLALLVVAMVVTSILGFTLRPPGRYLRNGTREPGHRRRRGRTGPDPRFPRGPPSELRDQTGGTPPQLPRQLCPSGAMPHGQPTSGRQPMHGGRRSTKLTCPLVLSTRYPVF